MKKDMDLARRIRGDRENDFVFRGDDEDFDKEAFIQLPYKNQKYGMEQLA